MTVNGSGKPAQMIDDIAPPVRDDIIARLRAAEQQHQVTILYACESGSRAWGFASPDSDYDVRFIYAHTEDWYLSFDVERHRDVIEYPIVDEIDCNGWDIRKALYLFTRSNGALLEWLNSPICYVDNGPFATTLRTLAESAPNRIALCYHYSHMARSNAREYLRHEQVRLKKYFYVLRPLLAIRYVEQYDRVPPVEFERLVDAVAPASIRPDIAELLALKRRTPELGLGPPRAAIDCFVATETERHNDAFKGQGRPDLLNQKALRDQLNDIFRTALRQTTR